MKRKQKLIAASIAMCLSIGFSVAAVSCGGSYQMTDFIVNTANVVLNYDIGNTVDLSALQMTAKFSDDTKEEVAYGDVRFYLDGVDITDNLSKITESAGVKTITIKYVSGKVEKSQTIIITVSEDTEKTLTALTSFNRPQFLADYEASLNAATNDTTANNFEGVFFKNKEDVYVVGDDNAFKFVPQASYIDVIKEEEITLTNFVADTTAWLQVDGSLVALEKRATEATHVYEYYYNGSRYMTELAEKNEYEFSSNALGQILKISVLPDENVYEYEDFSAVDMEFKVVDGFNIYDEKDLCVLDNSDRGVWDAMKGQIGLNGDYSPNGVILHQNTTLTEAGIPDSLKYTLPDDYEVYYRDDKGTIDTPEAFGLTRTFLWDKQKGNNDDDAGIYALYEHTVAAGQSFVFYGNYFSLDLTKVPLVAAFEPSISLGDNKAYYGSDFSNTTFLQIIGNEDTRAENEDESLKFFNLAVSGNANMSKQYVVDKSTDGYQGDNLIFAGGLIFSKVKHLRADFDNMRTYNCFISYFSEYNAITNYNHTKCYDSFQNAMYLWAHTDVTITNSYFKRAGGPLVIMNHDDPEKENADERIPMLEIDDNSEMESYLTGSEIWFKSVQATSVVDQIKAMDAIFNQFGKTILKDKQLNILALVMRDATDAAAALNQIETQGKVTYKDAYLDRMDGSEFATMLKEILKTGAPTFNVGTNILYYTGNSADPIGFAPGADQTAVIAAFKNDEAEYITLNMGGLSVILGYNNLQA